MALWKDIIHWLDNNPGTHTYGEVAAGLGKDPARYGQAMGSSMKKIHREGLHEYCVRVVSAKTGRHGCSQPPPGSNASALPRQFPREIAGAVSDVGRAGAFPPEEPIPPVHSVPVPSGGEDLFDAYVAIDWSSANKPTSGADSIWWAVLVRGSDRPLTTNNFPTRSSLEDELISLLRGQLADKRVLVGWDFPFGFPRGFASAWGYQGSLDPWDATWQMLDDRIKDSSANRNNRFAVAAALNKQIHRAFGPFYGRPASVQPVIAQTLSTRQRDHFSFPLRLSRGISLEKRRATDIAVNTQSSPWFLFGGANSVGAQALVGIPRVCHVLHAIPKVIVWPFQSGATDRSRRVVMAEIYPSMFYTRSSTPGIIHDEQQVIATVQEIAKQDAAGRLADWLNRPIPQAALEEEGWILGA